MFYILIYNTVQCTDRPEHIIALHAGYRHNNLRQRRVVLREVLVVVRVVDRLRRVALRERLRARLAVDVVVGAAVDGEVGRLHASSTLISNLDVMNGNEMGGCAPRG